MSSPKSPRPKPPDRRAVLIGRIRLSPAQPHDGGAGRIAAHARPGLVTGTANVDPSLVVTATVVGAAFHFSLLWVIVLCIPFLFTVFAVSARMGMRPAKGWLIYCAKITAEHLANDLRAGDCGRSTWP